MPELGGQVLYYTHEDNDGAHRTNDVLALVVGVRSEHFLDLVTFPPKGPVQFVTAYDFDPSIPVEDLAPGRAYWRTIGSEPPDFEAAFKAKHDEELKLQYEGEKAALAAKHKAELARASPDVAADLALEQEKERKAFDAKWASFKGATSNNESSAPTNSLPPPAVPPRKLGLTV